MKKISAGALAALLAGALLAAPAGAAAGNVAVRVEGDAQTLLPRTVVTTTDKPVGKAGQTQCSGTSALGALDLATAGNWAGAYDDRYGSYSMDSIMGETHTAATSSYWAFWINYTYSTSGVCVQQVQEGDDLLFVSECYAPGCANSSPLRISGVPATVPPGTPVTIKVDEYSWAYTPDFTSAETSSKPAEGATVRYGGADATIAADGTAQLTFSGAGPVSIDVTKPGRVRTSALTCVTSGADGSCGTTVPPGVPLGTEKPDDKTAPVASFSRLKDGKVYARKRAPRKLAGSVTPDPSGLLSVRLSILRAVGDRCWAFEGASERFERHRCGGHRSFRIGDRADWSYLLPARLRKGRYTIRAVAIDKAGNDSVTKVVIRVR
jgi:hypothetical protein